MIIKPVTKLVGFLIDITDQEALELNDWWTTSSASSAVKPPQWLQSVIREIYIHYHG